jgi:hypothetical protein
MGVLPAVFKQNLFQDANVSDGEQETIDLVYLVAKTISVKC